MSRKKIQPETDAFLTTEIQSRIFSLVTHDMRNLFASVVGYVRLKRRNSGMPETESRLLLEELEYVGNRADHLFDLMSFGVRYMKGMQQVHPENTSVLPYIRDTEELLRNEMNRKKITLHLHSDISKAEIFMDPVIFGFVVRQVLHNACKFSFQDGKIEVGYSVEKGVVILSVRDAGKGVSPAIVPILFTGSQECVTYGTEDEKGYGLGLALSQHFLRQCGASLRYVPAEKGSVFEILIPEK